MGLAPGQTSESFIREVDESLRRSQAENFAKRYGKWIVGLLFLFLAGVAAFLWWRNDRAERAAADSEALSAVFTDIGQNRLANAPAQLDAIAGRANPSMAASARLTRAALALQSGARPDAIAQYRAVSADDDVPQAYRDAATLRLVQLEYDSLKPDEVIARLQPLAVKGNAWFGSAGELTALAMVKAGRRSEAARLLSSVAADASVPPSIRARTGELASSLSAPTAPATPAAPAAPAAR